MISIWRRASSKTNGMYDICPMAEDTLEIVQNNDTVELRFTSGYVKKANDFIINIGSDSRMKLVQELLKSIAVGKPKNITDYTVQELTEALKAKLKSED